LSFLASLTLRDALLRAALVLFGVAFALAVWEVALRWLEPSPRTMGGRRVLHELRLDRPWLYRLRPGTSGYMTPQMSILYRVNADGFRDRLRERPKPDGVYRILVLGDSVTFGYGVEAEQSFPRLLEDELAERAPAAGIEVLNFGVGGYNPYTEVELFKDIGTRYEPDLVIVQFCINDLDDPTASYSVHSRQRLAMIPDAAYPDPSLRQSPLRVSYLPRRPCRASRVCSRIEDGLQRVLGDRFAPSDRFGKEGQDAVDIEWRWL
jgi:hypothetical protein